ncbi:16S rRNA (cytosine(967)-C(5))-methyltransferase RsmB, partial [Streptococcus anginosus]
SDRDLYTRLVYGSLQFHWTLQELLKQVLKRYKRTKKWLLALLELSAYQHYYLDAVPDHAIVDEAVRIAKKRGNQTLGRFT